MTRGKHTGIPAAWKEAFGQDADWLRGVVQGVVQEVLESEMDACLQAGKHERTAERLGYRSGHYERTLVTRVGRLELRVPQDREGRFSTEVFERYQRSEKALVSALASSTGLPVSQLPRGPCADATPSLLDRASSLVLVKATPSRRRCSAEPIGSQIHGVIAGRGASVSCSQSPSPAVYGEPFAIDLSLVWWHSAGCTAPSPCP
jgi:hypothetical protein